MKARYLRGVYDIYTVDNEFIDKLALLLEDCPRNNWAVVGKGMVCYLNSKWFLHIIEFKARGASCTGLDYLVKRDGSLQFANKEYRFESRDKFEKYLWEKHGMRG